MLLNEALHTLDGNAAWCPRRPIVSRAVQAHEMLISPRLSCPASSNFALSSNTRRTYIGRVSGEKFGLRGSRGAGAGRPVQDLRALQDGPLQPVRADGVPCHAGQLRYNAAGLSFRLPAGRCLRPAKNVHPHHHHRPILSSDKKQSLTGRHQLTGVRLFSRNVLPLSPFPPLWPLWSLSGLSCLSRAVASMLSRHGTWKRAACPRLPGAVRETPLGLLFPAARGNDARGGGHVRAGFCGRSRLSEGRNSREFH